MRRAAGLLLAFLALAAPAAAGPKIDALVVSADTTALYGVTAAGAVTATVYRGGRSVLIRGASWSPDGAQLMFATWDGETRDSAIYVADADGSNLRTVATGEAERDAVGQPVWVSASELAFHRRDPSLQTSALWLVGADGGGLRLLAGPASDADYYPPAMQPNGSLLLYSNGTRRLLVDVRSGVTQPLPTAAMEAAWSPDGRELAFAGAPGSFGIGGLEVMRPDGSGRRTLLPYGGVPAYASAPAWSPDGRRIAFTGMRVFYELYSRFGTPVRPEIYSIGADGTGLTQLTGLSGDALYAGGGAWSSSPSWSPDGSRLSFRDRRYGRYGDETKNWLMNADGSCEQQWAPELATRTTPLWRPGAVSLGGRMDCLSVTLRVRTPRGNELGVRGTLPVTLVVRNDGTQTLSDLRVALGTTRGSLSVAGFGCGRGPSLVCLLGSLEPGRELTFTTQASARTPGSLKIHASASYTGGDDIFPPDDSDVGLADVLPCDIVGTWGEDRLTGSPRRDWICGRPGADRIDAGAGNDRIEAGSGADFVIAGPGRDVVHAGGGGDVVDVRDGERDYVNCGTENDSVLADRKDVVSNCERVRRR